MTDKELLRRGLESNLSQGRAESLYLVHAERGEGGFSSYSAPWDPDSLTLEPLDGDRPPEGDTPGLWHLRKSCTTAQGFPGVIMIMNCKCLS